MSKPRIPRRLLCSGPALEADDRSEVLGRALTSAIVCAEADGDEGSRTAPDTIMLVPAAGRDGLVNARDGRTFRVDRDAVIEAARNNGADLMLDRDHNSIFSFGPVPAAGWILADTVRRESKGKNAAIVADVVWTPDGRADVEALNFRFVSPAFDPRALSVETKGTTEILNVAALLNAGIVNQPALRMPALARQEIATMNREAICKALGLPVDANDETILTACAALVDARDNPPTVEAAPVEGIPVEEYRATCATLADVQQQLATLTAKTAADAAAELVASALRDERITPAEVDSMTALASSDPAMFSTIVDARVPGMFSNQPTGTTAPAVLPTGTTTPGSSSLSAQEIFVARKMGIDPDAFLATKQANAKAAEERALLGTTNEAPEA